MRHIFIINPKAGKGKTLKYIPIIKEKFMNINEEYIIELTEKVGHATEIARRYAEKGKCRIYAIGGDGTINEVLNGIVGTDSSLAVIPSGSGNDFVRSMISGNFRKNILTRTINGTDKAVDIGCIDHERYFINIASIGLDAEIAYGAQYFKRKRWIPSKLAYLLSVFVTIFKYKAMKMKILLDSTQEIENTLFIAIANGKYYGGGIKIAPSAELNDGYFEICKVKNISLFKILMLMPRAILGKHEGLKEAVFRKVKNIEVSAERNMLFNIDGEIVQLKHAKISMIPSALNVVIPRSV
ncbi:diacylglycerol/lipid kinase family protein [Clostridium oryzae]|nr:diacylglycerol kinase family protein [Clostridium oryzae]